MVFTACGGEAKARENPKRRRLVLSGVEVSRIADNSKFFFGGKFRKKKLPANYK